MIALFDDNFIRTVGKMCMSYRATVRFIIRMVTSVKTFFTSFRACAQEDCTFVPEGYITESASIN